MFSWCAQVTCIACISILVYGLSAVVVEFAVVEFSKMDVSEELPVGPSIHIVIGSGLIVGYTRVCRYVSHAVKRHRDTGGRVAFF